MGQWNTYCEAERPSEPHTSPSPVPEIVTFQRPRLALRMRMDFWWISGDKCVVAEGEHFKITGTLL